MKNITLKIIGKQYDGENQSEEMEFVTDGKMSYRNGTTYLVYDESEFSGFPGCKTVLKLSDKGIKMKRRGNGDCYGAELMFGKGQRFSGRYDTPFGNVDIEVLTNNIKASYDNDKGGNVDIDYHVMASDLVESRNTLSINFSVESEDANK